MSKKIEITRTEGLFGYYYHQEGDRCSHCGDTVVRGHFGYNGYCSQGIEAHVTILHERVDPEDIDILFDCDMFEERRSENK